jgi:hypothetical protein
MLRKVLKVILYIISALGLAEVTHEAKSNRMRAK